LRCIASALLTPLASLSEAARILRRLRPHGHFTYILVALRQGGESHITRSHIMLEIPVTHTERSSPTV